MKISLKHFVLVLAFPVIFCCSTNAPLKTLYYKAEESSSQNKMIIFLKGRGGSHDVFASDMMGSSMKSQMPEASENGIPVNTIRIKTGSECFDTG